MNIKGGAMIDEKQEEILNFAKNILSGKEKLAFAGCFCGGFSERCIETPWAAHHLKGVRFMLDIGFTFASAEYLGLLLEAKEKYGVILEAVDIIKPERVKTRYPEEWRKSILEVPVTIGNVINVVLPEEHFDAVTMISTIEHIGFDEPAKTVKGSSFERMNRPEDVPLTRAPDINKAVLENLSKTIKRNGKLLLSVPMGMGGAVILRDSLGFYTAQWEYEEKSWREIVGHQNFSLLEEKFFKLAHDGWSEVASPAELKEKSSYMKPHAEGVAVCVLVKK